MDETVKHDLTITGCDWTECGSVHTAERLTLAEDVNEGISIHMS